MKTLKLFVCSFFVVFLAGCGGEEKAESVQADETAQQMQDASVVILARNEARKVVSRHWTDTTELERIMLESDSVRIRYEASKRVDLALQYDSVYRSTIMRIRPDLMRYLPKR